MTKRDNIQIEINIAGERMLLTVPFERQSAVRDTEAEINDLYRNWRGRFPKKTDKEILAMMVYQFASFYDDMLARQRQTVTSLQNVDEALGRLIDD